MDFHTATSEHWLALFAGLISLKPDQSLGLFDCLFLLLCISPDDLCVVFLCVFFWLNISYSLGTKPHHLFHLKIPNDLLICFLEPTSRP